jgi:anti-anti-sigma regulatory factor
MRHDDKHESKPLLERLETAAEEAAETGHIVFDFTGLEQSNVADLALILTARLQSGPTESVWVRSLPWRTAQVLKILRLDHLFRHYPDAEEQLN